MVDKGMVDKGMVTGRLSHPEPCVEEGFDWCSSGKIWEAMGHGQNARTTGDAGIAQVLEAASWAISALLRFCPPPLFGGAQ